MRSMLSSSAICTRAVRARLAPGGGDPIASVDDGEAGHAGPGRSRRAARWQDAAAIGALAHGQQRAHVHARAAPVRRLQGAGAPLLLALGRRPAAALPALARELLHVVPG